MLHTRAFFNEYCEESKQPQNVTVYFQLAKPESLNDFKRVKFDCDNAVCKLRGTAGCFIFKSANP